MSLPRGVLTAQITRAHAAYTAIITMTPLSLLLSFSCSIVHALSITQSCYVHWPVQRFIKNITLIGRYFLPMHQIRGLRCRSWQQNRFFLWQTLFFSAAASFSR